MTEMPLKEFHNYLERISNRGVKPGLERILAALDLLHNPQKNYRVIHVAGTNGKGSVCYLLSQLLGRSGYLTGLAISPHVIDYRERIQFVFPQNPVPTMIPVSELIAIHEKIVKTLPADHDLTYFEWNILLALVYFSEIRCEFVVLETGLGGRLDATNVADSILSAVTTIGLDHMEFLGDTTDKILCEKLGIVKRNSMFLFGPNDEALSLIAKKKCEQKNTEYHHVSEFTRDIENLSPTSALMHFSSQQNSESAVDVFESYLAENLKFALSLGLLLQKNGVKIDFQSFLHSADLILPPARLELLRKSPLIFLDGAHNEPALVALKKFLTLRFDDNYDLAFGCLANRPFLKLAEIIKSKFTNYWIEFDGGAQSTPRETLLEAKKKWGGEVVSLNNTPLDIIFDRNASSRPIVICGSLYLCGQVKAIRS